VQEKKNGGAAARINRRGVGRETETWKKTNRGGIPTEKKGF